MNSRKDISYGIIPIRRVGDQWEVFVIHQFSRIKNNSYWVFPKGHPENDETPLETARRELKEETNMEAVKILENPTFSLKYSFVFNDTQIEKEVVFFIGIIEDDSHQLAEEEVKEAGWYSLAEARRRLDYQNTRDMFVQASQFVEKYQP